ncbi:MAG: YdcF family protein [Selenomonadaceae bacterium]|nr:YdcF family protein [Selenomonadaceae bacterium]
MIYFLKFGAAFVMPPGIFILLFLWISYKLFRRREQGLAAALLVASLILYALSTSFVSSALMRNLESAYLPPENPSGDVIVTLGGGATQDTPDMDGKGGLTDGASSRLLTAARLYHRLHVPVLITGGQVFEDWGAEALIARRLLLGLGVPERDIIVETESKTTGQNAAYTAAILKRYGLSRPILVTSAFHMKRSVLNFEKNGVAVTPYPTGYRVNVSTRALHYTRFAPQAYHLDNSVCVLQEELRYWVTRLTGF